MSSKMPALAINRGIAGPMATELHACRRNNKLEKRKRNRAYARRFQTVKGGPSRRSVVVDEKRAIVANSEEKFVAKLFKLTSDDDMPAYTAFSFA